MCRVVGISTLVMAVRLTFQLCRKNGHAYRSIGKGADRPWRSEKEDMSMQAIRHWGETHSEAEVRELLEQNPSFVFFKLQSLLR